MKKPHNPCNSCNKAIKGSEYDLSQCRWCWLNLNTNLYNKAVDNTKRNIILPCINQGVLVSHAKCSCPRKNTYVCEVGAGDNGKCIPLVNCGPNLCPKYEADN